MNRLQNIFEHKKVSSTEFRGVQAGLGMINPENILAADWKTRDGTIELHKGLHWINLELAEFIEARPEERPEELADVLHFLVEFCLLFGYDWDVVPDAGGEDPLDGVLLASKDDPLVFPDVHTNARFMILAVLQVADMLKNKPWKQTLRTELDPIEFRRRVCGMWYWFGAVARVAGFSSQQVYDEFIAKELKNGRRIATGV